MFDITSYSLLSRHHTNQSRDMKHPFKTTRHRLSFHSFVFIEKIFYVSEESFYLEPQCWRARPEADNYQIFSPLAGPRTYRGGRRGGGGDLLGQEGGGDDGDLDLHHEHLEPTAPEHEEPDLDDGDGDTGLPALLLTCTELAAQVRTLKIGDRI